MLVRLLIVDDESRQRKGLVNFIKRIKPYYEICEAGNGEEAKKIVQQLEINIIITDIKMPRKDGLEFLREIQKCSGHIKTVIVSGYPDFTYAQKAISLGVSEYILKPVDPNKLYLLLNKIEKQIMQCKLLNILKCRFNGIMNLELPFYSDDLLAKFVDGTLNAVEKKIVQKEFLDKGGYVFVIKDLTYFGMNKATRNQINLFIKRITLKIKWCYCFESGCDIIGIVCDNSYAKPLLKYIVRSIHNKLHVDVKAGLSSFYPSLYHFAMKAYNEAKIGFEYSFYVNQNYIVFYNAMRRQRDTTSMFSLKKTEQVYDLIHIRKIDKGIQLIKDIILSSIKQNGYPKPTILRSDLSLLLLNITNRIPAPTADLLKITLAEINICFSIYKIFDIIRNLFIRLSAEIDQYETGKNNLFVKQIVDFVNQNYTKDISLESVSQKFNFSCCYFSSLFKKITGVNFSRYLSNLRLNYSRELLEQTNKKVYKISSLIGYNDSKYFIKVFKKQYGFAPDEYRNLISCNGMKVVKLYENKNISQKNKNTV